MTKNKTSPSDAMTLKRPPYQRWHGNHGGLHGGTLTWWSSYLFNDMMFSNINLCVFISLSHCVWTFSWTKRIFWWEIKMHNFKDWNLFYVFIVCFSKQFLIIRKLVVSINPVWYGIGQSKEEETNFTTCLSTPEKLTEGFPKQNKGSEIGMSVTLEDMSVPALSRREKWSGVCIRMLFRVWLVFDDLVESQKIYKNILESLAFPTIETVP